MNRLRVRVELNRRKAGVPLQELVSVVEETHKFFHLLAEDVNIPAERGEWHASNFDPESLNFTAEFDGPASVEQIHAFGAAFGGSTSLRSETIAQFTRIADFIGEDELVGFGLYRSDEEEEPAEWRCLSRRDALRFADEIHLLAKAAGVGEQETSLAVMNGSVGGRRLFKDRREREALATDPSRWMREVESNFSRRIALLEGEIEAQTRKIQTLENSPDAEERFLKMLGAMEAFWNQAPRQLALAPASGGSGLQPVTGIPEPPAAAPVIQRSSSAGWGIGIGLATAALVATAAWSFTRAAPGRPPVQPVSIAAPALPAVPPPEQAAAPVSIETHPPAEPAPKRDATPEMARQIALEIPAELRPQIASEVLVNVNVGIDRDGKVTSAEVASTKGDGAEALSAEALKAARWFRFRPAKQGKKTVPSQTTLTFTFDPSLGTREN